MQYKKPSLKEKAIRSIHK